MMRDRNQIDLEPHEYKRDRPVQKEPILGPNWKVALAGLAGWIVMFTIIHLVVVRGL